MRIHFQSSPRPASIEAVKRLIDAYGQSEIAQADFIVPVGGDGTALKALHASLLTPGKPVFAMRLPDSVGALANGFSLSDLRQRLRSAQKVSITPLQATAKRVNGDTVTLFGINEIVVSRQRLQAAKLQLRIGNTGQHCQIVGDGVLISTPIGSTGYNQSAGGPTLMMNSQLLAITGLAVCRPGKWRSIVVDNQVPIEIEVLEPAYRPVRLETVVQEAREISSVRIASNPAKSLTLLREEGSSCLPSYSNRLGRPARKWRGPSEG